MQRSVYLPSGHLVKNNSAVVFSAQLDINHLLLGNAPSNYMFSKSKKKNISHTNHNPTFHEISNGEMSNYLPILHSWATDCTPQRNEPPIPGLERIKPRKVEETPSRPYLYNLTAVILHYGHHESGHFITLRRVKYKTHSGEVRKVWFRISDSTVDRIIDVENDVYRHGSLYAYMLFYER